jgi:hypothetical protein
VDGVLIPAPCIVLLVGVPKARKGPEVIEVRVVALVAHLETVTVFIPEPGAACPTKLATDCIKNGRCASYCLLVHVPEHFGRRIEEPPPGRLVDRTGDIRHYTTWEAQQCRLRGV